MNPNTPHPTEVMSPRRIPRPSIPRAPRVALRLALMALLFAMLRATATGIASYDAQQRLLQQPLADSAEGLPRSIQFLYDADGLRVGWVTVTGDPADGASLRETNRFVFDLQSPTGVAQVMAHLANGRVSRLYFHGLQPVSEIEISAEGDASSQYLITDGHLSVRASANRERGIDSSFDYDAFGNQIVEGNSGTNRLDHRYAGSWFDADLGSYYLRARRYDPGLGRFSTPDIVEGRRADPPSLHRYLYSRNDPINRIDPNGESDYSLKSLAAASSISATLSTLDTLIATRGRAKPRLLAQSFTKGAIMGAGAYLVGPLFYAAEAGGRLAFNSLTLATAFWGLGTAFEARDAPLLAYRALTLALFSGAADNDPSVRVYCVEGEPNTRVITSEDGEIAVRDHKILFLNLGQKSKAVNFLRLKREGNLPGAASPSYEVSSTYLQQLQASAVPEHLAIEYPDLPIQMDLGAIPDQFGIRQQDFDRLLDAVLQGSSHK